MDRLCVRLNMYLVDKITGRKCTKNSSEQNLAVYCTIVNCRRIGSLFILAITRPNDEFLADRRAVSHCCSLYCCRDSKPKIYPGCRFTKFGTCVPSMYGALIKTLRLTIVAMVPKIWEF